MDVLIISLYFPSIHIIYFELRETQIVYGGFSIHFDLKEQFSLFLLLVPFMVVEKGSGLFGQVVKEMSTNYALGEGNYFGNVGVDILNYPTGESSID